MTTTFQPHPTATAKRDGLGSIPAGCADVLGVRTGFASGYRGNGDGWTGLVIETHRRAGPASTAA